jgi:hypothetical protein
MLPTVDFLHPFFAEKLNSILTCQRAIGLLSGRGTCCAVN